MWSLFSRTSSFPYEILDLISENSRSIWKLHKGKKKANGETVTIFVCDGENASTTVIDLAKAAVKRLKMLKHPSVLTFIDSYESEKSVYLVTEVVTPLIKWLSDVQISKNPSNLCLAAWGLLQITQGLSFITNDAKLVHNNVNCNSVYVTQGGEWKVFGFEYTTADPEYLPVKAIQQLSIYEPPDVDHGTKRRFTLWSVDMWGLCCLFWEVFNEKQLDQSMSLKNTSKIPKSLVSTYTDLASSNPMSRPNPKDVVDKLRKKGQFFHNDLIETLIFLDEIHIKDDNEKHRFFSSLSSKLDNIPNFISKNKILPALLTAHEFSNLGSVLLTPIFKIGHILEDTEYQTQIVPCVVKMFSSTDRSTRLKLLQQIETLADHLDPKTVNDQIFQPLVTGFQDTNPTIREHTVKAVLYLAPKLNYQNLNVEVLKHFARLQSRDDQGGIRTNTTVCLGKIASCLHPDTRQKCLVSAFTRAMRDPFPPGRVAGVTALGATQQFYPLSDVASKILPALSHLTLDPEKTVRGAVFRVLKGFLGKLEKVSEDPELKDVMEKEVNIASSTSSPSSWAGWAVSVASKFYKGPLSQPNQPQSNVNNSGSSSSTAPSTRTSSVASSDSSRFSPSTETKITAEQNSRGKEQSISKLLESVVTVSEEAGDGWQDDEDEDWGSLEQMNDPQENVNKSQTTTSNSAAPSSNWGKTSNNDFFSSFETKSAKSSISKEQETVKNVSSSSWDSWEDPQLEEEKLFGNQKSEEAKRIREEKKLQRQKEIEAKRAARSGPMKLGARKI